MNAGFGAKWSQRCPNVSQMVTNGAKMEPNGGMCPFGYIWALVGLCWAPFVHFFAPFGTIWPPFGHLLGTFGFIWLQKIAFGPK